MTLFDYFDLLCSLIGLQYVKWPQDACVTTVAYLETPHHQKKKRKKDSLWWILHHTVHVCDLNDLNHSLLSI